MTRRFRSLRTGLPLLAWAGVPMVPALVASQTPGWQLEPGMQLVYESDGVRQAPWTIDSVRIGVPLLAGAQCAEIQLRRRPEATALEQRRLCVANDTLYTWETGADHWSVSRPVGSDMTWQTRRSNGDVMRFETTSVEQESIAGRTIPVVLTVITFVDSRGRPTRRLRERYALSLATATRGVFESPDSSNAANWVETGTFELREIRLR